jgi:hypothetical protein
MKLLKCPPEGIVIDLDPHPARQSKLIIWVCKTCGINNEKKVYDTDKPFDHKCECGRIKRVKY